MGPLKPINIIVIPQKTHILPVIIHEGSYSGKVFLDYGFLLRGGRGAGSSVVETVPLETHGRCCAHLPVLLAPQ